MHNDTSKKSLWAKRLGGYVGTVLSQSVFGLVTTYVGLSMLAAEDYGVYGMVAIVTALLSALAAGPITILSSGRYLKMEEWEKAHVNSTLLLFSLSIGAIATGLLYLLWPFIDFLTGRPLSSLEQFFSALCIIPQALLILYNGLNYNQGFSGRILAVTLAQGVATLISMYMGLYMLSLGAASLYLAQLAGFSAAAFVSVLLVRRQFRKPSREWAIRWMREHKSYALNTFISSLPQFVENAVISRFAGLASLAAWQHSRIYNTFIMRAGKVVGLTIWPVSLAEAKENHFPTTRKAWRVVYVGFTLLGICAAFLAEPVIIFLTHNKLTAAAVIVPWWVVYNLLQNSGREAEAMLCSADLGGQVANASSMSKLIALIVLVPLLLLFGLAGALMAAMVEVVYFRYLLRRKAKRISNIPVMDSWAFGGSAIVVAAIVMERVLSLSGIEARVIAAVIGVFGTLFVARSVVLDVFLLYKTLKNVKPAAVEI